MLLATILAAVLLGGVLFATAAVSRDARRASSHAVSSDATLHRLLEFDLTHAATIESTDDGQSLTISGHCGIDPRDLSSTGRLARVIYRIQSSTHALVREQRFLDDGIRPQPWEDLVLANARRIDVVLQPTQGRTTVSIQRPLGDFVAEVRTR
jgi:hypothetical protein